MTKPKPPDYDKFCDPDFPCQINIMDVAKAAKLLSMLQQYVHHSPCAISHCKNSHGMNLLYKMENLQRSGSFKSRGMLCALLRLPEKERKAGVVIASLGNEALGMIYYTTDHSIPLVIVMPVTVAVTMQNRCTKLGAKVITMGQTLTEAQEHARVVSKTHGLTYLNSRDHPDILAGYGTIGLEILQDVPDVDAIIVPVGTGGLAAGVAQTVKSSKNTCRIYGVAPEIINTFAQTIRTDAPMTKFKPEKSIADSIAVSQVGVNSYNNTYRILDKLLLVKEDWIAQAMLELMEDEHYVVEGAGACPLAAIKGQLVPELKSKTVVCVVSGGNIDKIVWTHCLQMGRAMNGQYLKFRVQINSTRQAQAELFDLLMKKGYQIITQKQDRRWLTNDTYKIEVNDTYKVDLTITLNIL